MGEFVIEYTTPESLGIGQSQISSYIFANIVKSSLLKVKNKGLFGLPTRPIKIKGESPRVATRSLAVDYCDIVCKIKKNITVKFVVEHVVLGVRRKTVYPFLTR